MLTRAELIRDTALATSRALGCLAGLAVGDALGDLGRDDEHRKRYGLATTLSEDAHGTDDTEFALLTARALVDCDGHLTPAAVLQTWQRYVLDQGGVFERGGRPLHGAVANLRRGLLPPLSGQDNILNNDDGAAMRSAPIGIVCAGDPRRAAALAEIDAQVSHAGDGLWAAQMVAVSVSVAMVGGTVDEIVQAGLACLPPDSWLSRAMARAQRICAEEGSPADAWERLHTELWTPVHSASAEAIPQAFALFQLTQGDFRQGLFWAANFGRDADTIGAVVGALSGARQGAAVIPDRWIELVRRPSGVCLKFAADEDIPTLARQLARLICE